ncbi:hypothetical protein DVH05_006679 [Phytophthora capsici]|nr:hypothetical protein DVH05_006679 [Phytophthora capsici]
MELLLWWIEQPIREELQRGLAIINDHTVGEILENDSLVTDAVSLICFQTKLKKIEDAITAATSEVWGYWADPIQLYLHPAERVDVQDMINELFNKVLKAHYGEEGEVKGGEDEVHIGRMLVFFQDIFNFMDRCNAITINMINQLASLYQSFQNLWKTTFKLVHLHPVFDVLASLLEVMITIDAIVIDSPNIITSWDKY